MKRAERHHLKQDEFLAEVERVTTWVRGNQKNVVNVTLVVAAAALLLGGLYIYTGRQAESARTLLGAALDQYHGTVGARPEGADPSTPHFATADEKYRTALASFQKVTDQFSSYQAGRQARYYLGLCHVELKDFEAAERALQELRSGKRDLLYYLGSRSLAAVKVERSDYASASEIYRTLVDDKDNPLPKDHLLFELAKVEEKAGHPDEARLYYDRMVAEHPDSQLRGDAMTRSEALALQARSRASGG